MDIIKQILKEIKPELNFDESENFIEDGYLDSFDVITLTDMLQEKFKITIDGLDIIPDNFFNYEVISSLVKKNGGQI